MMRFLKNITRSLVAQLKAINDKVGGAITLTNRGVNLVGSAADLKDALAGSFAAGATHTGEVKVTGTYNVSQLKAINTGTDGALHLANRTVGLSGTAADVKAALANNFTTDKTHTGVVTLSDNTASTVNATDITAIETAKPSGNINIKNVSSVAATGVDRISIGSITHSVPAIDFKLEF